ncbi:MAG: caspase family protein [Planctomycetia bacterium]|nr:caspase family protein [Planctomycetia bacterium]
MLRYVAFIVWCLCIPSGFCSAATELPPESVLPGQRRSGRELPAETALPKSWQAAPDTRVGDGVPAEHALPPSMLVAQSRGGKEIPAGDDQAEFTTGRPPAGYPWLRMNFDGHTGAIRAVRFTSDGDRVCSAGDDKAVHVWTSPAGDAVQRGNWVHERTIRWQIERGPRGRIYALATGEDLLALAGHGATGRLGEILLVDPATGELKRVLTDEQQGHLQVVTALAFAPPGTPRRLASVDVTGRVVVWSEDTQTGLWRAKRLIDADAAVYGQDQATHLEAARRIGAIAFLGPQHVVVPQFEKQERTSSGAAILLWKLHRVNVETGAVEALSASGIHYRGVSGITASAEGAWLVSADSVGRLLFWDVSRDRVQVVRQRAVAVAISLTADGTRLAVGTARSPQLNGKSLVQVWNTQRISVPEVTLQLEAADDVMGIDIDPRGLRIAYGQANALVVRNVGANGDAVTLRPPVRPVLRVAFAKDRPYYRLAVGGQAGTAGKVELENTFDLQQVRLGDENTIRDAEWLADSTWQADWELRKLVEGGNEVFSLFEGNQRRARIPLDPLRHGVPTATCWIPNASGRPFAVAVGTSGRNNIYVFELADAGDCRLIRQFRGHEESVRSVSVSRDLRYLASGADDATVRVWPLRDLQQDGAVVHRWGASFAVEKDSLSIDSIRADGPLFHRGMRAGDVVQRLRWPEGNQVRVADKPEEMLTALQMLPFDTLVVFEYQRRGVKQESFQSFSAWQALVSLFVASDREWAYWTPAGYYDASFGGHRLFGWQLNQGLERSPDFFLAEQFRKKLERPDVMRRLMDAGSLDDALREARLQPPATEADVVRDEYRMKPRITILSPLAGATVNGSQLVVRATVQVRSGLSLAPPKAFANGVVSASRRLVEDRAIDGGRELLYEWNMRLPSDRQVLLNVIASTDAEVAESQSVVINHEAFGSNGLRQMYVFAAGVNEYRDAQIQRLDYAVDNARSVVDVLARRANLLYRSTATTFLDARATRSLWRNVTAASAESLRPHLSPDDLLVFFLSGHGVRDTGTSEYYFVTANARYADIKAERFGECMSFSDFAAFADLPCRKLVILDTCHSGAFQTPLTPHDLKAAGRALQDDMVFTFTASEGTQEAVEDRQRQLGRFTFRLVESLEGAADATANGGNGDGQVGWNEVVTYVTAAVFHDSASTDTVQRPTFGPADLLKYVELPLTSSPNGAQ